MITLIIVALVLYTAYIYFTRNHDYWKKRGVIYEKPVPLFGSHLKGFLMQKSLSQSAEDVYWKYPDEKLVGGFRGMRPELVIRDPDIWKQVLVADFPYMYRRGFIQSTSKVEPIMNNLFFADGDLWRLLRQRLTPAFTSGKLKSMFPLVVERAERLQARTLQAAAAGEALDARDLMARYTTDFIGACGFGLDADSLNDENSAFRKLGKQIFHVTPRIAIVSILRELFPTLFKNFKVFPKLEDDLISIVKQILKQRNFKPSGRNDFIDLLLECYNKGTIVGESIEKFKPDGMPEEVSLQIDIPLMAAQVFVFFAAGFETSSSATSFTLHQLAYNLDVQTKVHEEIDKVLNKHGNKLSYDAVQQMNYLEWTFKEGLRMFPSLGYLQRESARKYTMPGVNVDIDEGVLLMIPLQAIHNDSRYFENPSEFRPERFDPEIFDINKYVYMPFGEGPRNCIGARLGLMQSLAGLAAVLSRFTVLPAPNTKRHPVVDPASDIVQNIKGGLPLIFRQRNTNMK